MSDSCDVLVIGAGFYGMYLSDHFARRFRRVVICEQGDGPMRRASYNNQARIHNGYHYPRSILTAARSRVNFPRFADEFRAAVDGSFQKIYAIGRRGSKTSAYQFFQVMKRIGAPIERADKSISRLFDRQFVEDVFHTVECAFNADALRDVMSQRLESAGVEVRVRTTVAAIQPAPNDTVEVRLTGEGGESLVHAKHVFCCTYAQLNQPTAASGVGIVPLKHEMTELCLVEVPDELRGIGVTMMDGPFFSCMPFPARNLHSLSHVRHTPHCHWYDGAANYRPAYEVMGDTPKQTKFPHMVRDAARYLPALAASRYQDSLWEVKTILPQSETDDSRPILLRTHFGGIRNYHLVLGGKIDNVYDVLNVVEREFGWSSAN